MHCKSLHASVAKIVTPTIAIVTGIYHTIGVRVFHTNSAGMTTDLIKSPRHIWEGNGYKSDHHSPRFTDSNKFESAANCKQLQLEVTALPTCSAPT